MLKIRNIRFIMPKGNFEKRIVLSFREHQFFLTGFTNFNIALSNFFTTGSQRTFKAFRGIGQSSRLNQSKSLAFYWSCSQKTKIILMKKDKRGMYYTKPSIHLKSAFMWMASPSWNLSVTLSCSAR